MYDRLDNYLQFLMTELIILGRVVQKAIRLIQGYFKPVNQQMLIERLLYAALCINSGKVPVKLIGGHRPSETSFYCRKLICTYIIAL